MVAGREHVEHGDRGVRGQLLEDRVVARAHADGVDMARENERRVAGRLVARELELVRPQDQRVACQLDDAGLERDPRARGRLLEQKRHVASLQGARGVRSRFELERPVEQGVEVVGAQLGAGEEMPRQAREHTRA
jgi:hypothetical protein